MAKPRFIYPNVPPHASTVLITGEEFHHLRVRRVKPGDPVVLFDGLRKEFDAVVEFVGRSSAKVRISGQRDKDPVSTLRLVLATAIVRPDRLDMIVEKATELGVAEILFFTSNRSRPQDLTARVTRWERIACESAKQCQRGDIPAVCAPIPFTAMLARSTAELQLMIWEDAERKSDLASAYQDQPNAKSIALLVGPEGGFTTDEVDAATSKGFKVCRIGQRILRTETAAITSVAIAQFLWGDLCQPTACRTKSLPPALPTGSHPNTI
ncbi:MAG: 16S rRNA (uracil(1498)-N(3))-methyltransferase [Deltaproteobacteria bacterium]|nr:16S rRNA (uracil(1498)-N(3))-methyltransferase [Deltaproteobacteria bacterium]